MELAAVIMGVPVACLILFGLYQYKAHNKAWGMKLCLWLCGLLGLVGVGFGTESIIPPILIAAAVLGAKLTWRVCGQKYSGWRLHAMRGLIIGVIFWPLLAIRFHMLQHFGDYHDVLIAVDGSEAVGSLLYGLPGFLLAGIIALHISLITNRSEGKKRFSRPGIALLVLLLPCLNWYIAGMVDVHLAAGNGDLAILQYALYSRPGIEDARDEVMETPVMVAVIEEQFEAVRLLLRMGANAELRDRLNENALHLLVEFVYDPERPGPEPISIAKELIRAGADPDAKRHADYDGRTPLLLALYNGHQDLARLFIEHGADVNVSETESTGRTPLHWLICVADADKRMQLNLLDLLLKKGADPNAQDANGCTPLHLLPYQFYEDDHGVTMAKVAHRLIQAGADVDLKDRDGISAVAEIVRALDDTMDLSVLVPLAKATRTPNVDIAGTPLLGRAIQYGQLEAVRALVEAGADVNYQSQRGSTCLHIAASYGHVEIIKFLLEKEAKVRSNGNGHTPLHYVVQLDSGGEPCTGVVQHESDVLQIMKLLIDAGVDVNAKTRDKELTAADLVRGLYEEYKSDPKWKAVAEGRLKLLGETLEKPDRNDREGPQDKGGK